MMFMRLLTPAQQDDLRALCWQLQYNEWLVSLAELAANPRTNGIGTMTAPLLGDPVDWDTRRRRLVWQTQACQHLLLHPLNGNRALAECGPDVVRWASADASELVLSSADLAAVRSTPRDRAATRARTLLGALGPLRVRPVGFSSLPVLEDAAAVLARGDDFARRLQQLIDERLPVP